MIALDLAGVAVSSGSACSSGKVAPSHVLAAMGVKPELARGAIRLSLGWASAEADVDRFAEAFARRDGADADGAPGRRVSLGLGGIAEAFADRNFRWYSLGSIISWLSFFVHGPCLTAWDLTHSTALAGDRRPRRRDGQYCLDADRGRAR